jgi:hypothetical protein
MPDEKFKLPGSSYEELCKIIRAYGRLDKPENLSEVTKRSGVPRTTVSGNNAFLLSAGLVQGGKAKEPTPLGKRLANALDHEMADEIANAWREVVQSNDFLTQMHTAIKIRKGMDIPTLQGHIAYSAGEPKTPRVMTGAGTIIAILRSAGLIEENEGRLVPTSIDMTERPRTDSGTITPLAPASIRLGDSVRLADRAEADVTLQTTAGITIHIEIKVDAKPSDLDGLGTKLRRVIQEASGLASAEADK